MPRSNNSSVSVYYVFKIAKLLNKKKNLLSKFKQNQRIYDLDFKVRILLYKLNSQSVCCIYIVPRSVFISEDLTIISTIIIVIVEKRLFHEIKKRVLARK